MTIRKLAAAGVLALTVMATGAVSAEAGYRYSNGCRAPYGYNSGYYYRAYTAAPYYRARTYPVYGGYGYYPGRVYVPVAPAPVYVPYRVRFAAPRPGFFVGFHVGR